MAGRPLSSLLLAVAFVLSPLVAGCSKGSSGPGPCGTPTAAQCKDAVWLSSDRCGVAHREAMRTDPQAFCNQVVVDESKTVTEDLVPETVVDPTTGDTTQAKVVPNAADGVDTLLMPQTQVGLEQQTALTATAAGLSAAEQALRDQWAANGNRVGSCREYVHEKYLDQRRFEDAVAARHDDFPYIFDVAFGPSVVTTSIGSRVVNGDELRMRDGTPMTTQAIATRGRHPIADCSPSYGPPGSEYLVKNPFWALPLNVFEQVKSQVDANLEMAMQYSRCYDRVGFVPPPTPAAAWQWHRDQRAALEARGISLAEMAAWYAEGRAFQQTLVEYERPQPPCCFSWPSGPCCMDWRAARAALEARLGALFLKAYAAGCLSLSPGVCDWSAEHFVESLRGTFGPATEADYQRCLDLTGDDFAALTAKQFRNPDGSPWRPARDYTETASAIDQYFVDQAAWLAAFLSSLPPDVKDPIDGSLRPPGSEKSAHHEAGNSLFSAYYDYLLAWDTPGLGPHPADPQTGQVPPGPCLRGLESRGSFTAGATAFGSARLEVLDASFDAGLATGVGGHLEVLGVPVWGRPADAQWTILAESHDLSKTLLEKSKTFTVAYIPITVAGGIAGTLHLERALQVTVAPPSADGCYGSATATARFRPWVGLEAFASAAVGTAVASAGIECGLTLLRLETPFDLGVTLAADGPRLRLTPAATGDLVVRTLDGRISLFVEVDAFLFDVRYSYDVFRWSGLRTTLPLFRSSYTLVLDDLVPLLGP